MKEYRIMILLVSTLFIIAISCSSQLDNEDFSDMIGKGQNYTPPPIPVEEPTLKDKDGWKIVLYGTPIIKGLSMPNNK